MKLNPFKKRHLNEEMNLQITSMADIFTIILVFLLKSFSSGSMAITPSAGVLLPEAFASDSPVEALKLEISQNSVNVEGQPVTMLKHYEFDSADLAANGVSQSLTKALETQRKRELLIAKSNADVKVDPRIVIISDQHVPYATVKSVLASAALQGYTDFKLAVAKGN